MAILALGLLVLGPPLLFGGALARFFGAIFDVEFSWSVIVLFALFLLPPCYFATARYISHRLVVDRISSTLSANEKKSLKPEEIFLPTEFRFRRDKDGKDHCIVYVGNPLWFGQIMEGECDVPWG
ncbi:hypothetical protein [Niveibacterium sp.]|uniref:hypothetical protein n=1 Tax=Niveibacterium sp. TaxID=2017444 RepID=UPI0035B3F096